MKSVSTPKLRSVRLDGFRHRNRCPAKQRNDDVEYKDPITRFLDTVLSRNSSPPIINSEFSGEKLTGLSLQDLQEKLVEEITETNWFVTGNVDYRLFSDSFNFRDPLVNVNSIKEYASGVSRLFTEGTQMDIVSVEGTGDREIKMKWRLEAVLNLPFRPKVKAYYVTTYFRTNDEGLICEQEEFFSIPEWELVASIFFPNLGTPPAPPVEKN
eukprot:g6651.t1